MAGRITIACFGIIILSNQVSATTTKKSEVSLENEVLSEYHVLKHLMPKEGAIVEEIFHDSFSERNIKMMFVYENLKGERCSSIEVIFPNKSVAQFNDFCRSAVFEGVIVMERISSIQLVVKDLKVEMLVFAAANEFPRKRRKRYIASTQVQPRQLCSDAGYIGQCGMFKAMGKCNEPSVRSICPRTCNTCPYMDWESWGPWSKCSTTCSFGVRVRTRVCLQYPCHPASSEEIISCQGPPCKLLSQQGRIANKINLYDPKDDKEKEVVCIETEFTCNGSKKCMDNTRKCDGVNDCGSGEDEENCELGLRQDGKFGIINWHYHKCAEASVTDYGRPLPRIYRRCPGHFNDELNSFMWTWFDHDKLQHLKTRKCLALNVTYFNSSDTYKLEVILSYCDKYDLKQQWTCSGFQVRIKHIYDVLPQGMTEVMNLQVSDDGPGNQLNISKDTDETTEFYMLGTNKRLNICAKRGYGASIAWLLWTPCDKTCGGGTQKKKKDCAVSGDRRCGGGDLYEYQPCNTDPCPVICPPGFSAHHSFFNKDDINCFKVFDDRKSFIEAQKFCASNNWTLAADKDFRTHEFIMNLMGDVSKAYIGVYENLSARLRPPYSHLLRYLWDGQPVGGFQPWQQYSDQLENRGCFVGFGSNYHGSISSTLNGEFCEDWNSTVSKKMNESALLDAIASYETLGTMNRSNYCRNPDLSENSPWCRIKYNRGFIKQTCRIPDCLDVEKKSVPEEKDVFMIHSLEGENLCIAVLSSDRVVTTSCDCTDNRQNFYWWAGISLVNVGSGKCLGASSLPPKHGDAVTAETCSRRKVKLNQGWRTDDYALFLAWITDSGEAELVPPLYIMEHDVTKKKVVISDNRLGLFTVWNSNTGMMTMTNILKATPAGNYFLLKGKSCGMCITSKLDSRQLSSAFCDQHNIHQRWIKLKSDVLMNIVTGLCLSSYQMRFYVLLEECSDDNLRLEWKVSSDGRNSALLRHRQSGFYLTCTCTGYTQVCLTPDESDENEWEFITNEELPLKVDVTDDSGVLGYTFMLRANSNLTKCARPGKSPKSDGYSVVMVTCYLEDHGQLWWFSESGAQIKHRSLDLCIEASITDEESTIFLGPCSIGHLETQAWMFIEGPSPRDDDDLPGDFICLKSNHSVCLSVIEDADLGKDTELLSVFVKTKSRRWTAVIGGSFFIPLGKVQDCIAPWMEMKDYRGSRSWTRDGIECQKWSHQWPHRHPFTNDSQAHAGLDQNFCRKPVGIPSDILEKHEINEPWCLTMNPSLPWQDCSIARCPVTGVVLNARSGFWEISNGEEPLPFVCHALNECYFGNAEDYSGFYEHSGRGHCINWREYYGGDKNWPDHARCMNFDNDTLKPWCWVKKGVAQYCDLVVPCPKRCPDPSSKMRNMYITNITYSSPSKLYMPKSTVQVTCKRGYNLTIPGKLHQTWECNDDGEWTPSPITCRKIYCHPPAAVDNAVVFTRKTVFNHGAVAVYQCLSGFMIEPGKTLIEIKCLMNGTWSTVPYKCVPTCKDGWTPFNSSCYKLYHDRKQYHDYQSALEQCSSGENSGSLTVPKQELEYKFLTDLVAVSRGFTEESYWVGIRETYDSKPVRIKVNYSWIGDGYDLLVPESNIYLQRVRHHSFMIRSYGSLLEENKYSTYIDRCMFSDNETRIVSSKSCHFNDGRGMKWMWVTAQHLYNVDAELCLTALEHKGGSAIPNTPDSVFLAECDLRNKSQMFTCGPENPHFLRLKHHRFSYLVLNMTQVGTVIQTGSSNSLGNLAMWLTYPGYYYLCHWTIKESDPLFLVHNGQFPTFVSFFEKSTDLCEEGITGAVLVNTSIVEEYLKDNTLDWCGCPYMTDENGKLVNMMPNSLGKCLLRDLSDDAAATGLRKCKGQQFGDSLCHRPKKSKKDRFGWMAKCLAVNVPNTDESSLVTRECKTRLPGYICQEPAKWACRKPFQPPNSIPVFEAKDTENMRFTYQASIRIQCEQGYWIESIKERSMLIYCNRYLNWEVFKKKTRDGDKASFIDNHKEREKMVKKIKCSKTKCNPPPDILGMILVNVSDDFYYLHSVATYECVNGTWFNPTKIHHSMTCMSDGTWQPILPEEEKCRTVTCPEPLPLRNTEMNFTGVVHGSELIYTCNDGYWIKRYSQTQAHSFCDHFGKWDPNHVELNTTCIAVSCARPADKILERANMFVTKELVFYGHESTLTVECNSGYWFDKDAFVLNFTCDVFGIWQPFQPHLVRCERIFCNHPDDVPGAVRFGTDFATGSHVRYYCARRNWIRRQFLIYNPHWKRCLVVTNVISSPIQGSPERPQKIAQISMDENCGMKATLHHWWIWHWSYHLKNRLTNLCLTAAAIPILKEDLVPVTMEVCGKHNIYQMWSCTSSHINNWMVKLRACARGGFLIAVTDPQVFWTGQGNINMFITGDNNIHGWENFWKIFDSDDKDLSICFLKEGQFYEQTKCNSYGKWYPDPNEFECTLVYCNEPHAVKNAKIVDDDVEVIADPEKIKAEKTYFRWKEAIRSMKEYNVTSKVTVRCDKGYWLMPGVREVSITCLDNSLWDPDPRKLECTEVVCPSPILTPRKIVTFKRPKSKSKSISESLRNPSAIPPFHGEKSFEHKDILFKPKYGDLMILRCFNGFWIEKSSIKSDNADQFFPRGLNGSNIFRTTCLWNGSWSFPNAHESLKCVPLFCHDPGDIPNGQRIPADKKPARNLESSLRQGNASIFKDIDGSRSDMPSKEKLYPYGWILQYQCNLGFWLRVEQSYSEVRCNESGHWDPEIERLSCFPLSCGDPGAVVDAVKFGENYSMHDEVTYKCSDGYRIKGVFKEQKLQCMRDGKWFPPPYSVRCEWMKCNNIPDISNAYLFNRTQKFKDKLTPGDEIVIRCLNGYYIDLTTIALKFKCGLEGNWVPFNVEIQCVPAICPTPPVLENRTIYNQKFQYFVNDTIHYSCPVGTRSSSIYSYLVDDAVCTYKLRKNSLPEDDLQPVYETYWHPDPESFRCAVVTCPHPGFILHTSLIVNGLEYGNTSAYTCKHGYTLDQYNSSIINVRCGRHGKWEPDTSTLKCQPIKCHRPPVYDKWVALRPTKSVYYVGDQLKVYCPTDYWLVLLHNRNARGDAVLITECNEDGGWTISTEFLICETIHCKHPGYIENGLVKTDDSAGPTELSVSTKLRIRCKIGYILSITGAVESEFQCSKSGLWEPVALYDNPPYCVFVACVDPGMRNNSVREVDGFAFGNTITYTALPGFFSMESKQTRITLICSTEGKWIPLSEYKEATERSAKSSSAINETSFEDESASRWKRNAMDDEMFGDLLTFIPAECGLPYGLSPDTHMVEMDDGKHNLAYGSQMAIACDEGFIIALNVTSYNITCTELGWIPLPSTIKCLPEDEVYCSLPPRASQVFVIGDSYHVGSNATAVCEPGYEISKGVLEMNITCNKHGVWTPSIKDIKCEKVTCDPPPLMENAERNYTNVTYGSEAVYQCKKGYYFKDSEMRMKRAYAKCKGSHTWDPDPLQRKCTLVDCGPLLSLYGNATFTSTTYKSSAKLSCRKGYSVSFGEKMMGVSAEVFCTVYGFWAENVSASEYVSIRCVPLQCNSSQLPTESNAHVSFTAGNYYRSKATYRCTSGYEAPGKKTSFSLECSHDGNWKSDNINKAELVCRKKKCPEIIAQSGVSDVLYKMPNDSEFLRKPVLNEYGAQLKYICKSHEEATAVYQCAWHGQWDPPLSTKKCDELRCPEPPEMYHAKGNGDRKIGSSWVYSCESGFEVRHQIHSSQMNCTLGEQGKAVWFPPFSILLKCKNPSCEKPRFVPRHTQVFDRFGVEMLVSTHPYLLDLTLGSTLTFRCIPGYWQFSGKIYERKSTCEDNRQWNPDPMNIITCSMIMCPKPPEIQNVLMFSMIGSDRYWFNTSATYQCPHRMFFRDLKKHAVQSICGPKGEFVPDPWSLRCEPTECEEYMMPHADLYQLGGMKMGAYATYRCHYGYMFESSSLRVSSLKCGKDGRWIPDKRCVKVTCEKPDIKYIVFEENKEIRWKDKAYVSCEDGYYLTDDSKERIRTITCGPDGSFTPSISTIRCDPVPCQRPHKPKNANIFGDFRYGGMARTQCNYGYWTQDHNTSVVAECRQDGTWSRTFRQKKYNCVPVTCPSPPKPNNATQEGNGNTMNTKITYKCNEGYWLRSHSVANSPYMVLETCTLFGTWRPLAVINCVRIICPELPKLPSANLLGDKRWFGSVFYYVCEPMTWIMQETLEGWRLSGKKELPLTCGKNARWRPELPKPNCVSLYDARITEKGRSKTQHRKISSKLPKKWLEFDPELMTLSDSTVGKFGVHMGERTLRSYRDVKFLWDGNPLTFWVGGKNTTGHSNGRWIIDVFFGKPIALFAIMIMCADDTLSDVSNFSIIFSDSMNNVKEMGPFKVYGEGLIQGKIETNFPLEFASMANAFIYDGIMEEVLWMHIVLQPLYEGRVPAVREIGFYSSDVKWENIHQNDPMLPVSFALSFVLLAVTLSPMLYIIDDRKRKLIIPLFSRKNAKKLGLYSVQIEVYRSHIAECQMFFQLYGSNWESPVVYLGKDITFAPGAKYASIDFHITEDDLKKLDDEKHIRLMVWKDQNEDDAKSESLEDDEVVNVKKVKVRKLCGAECEYVSENPVPLMQFAPTFTYLEKQKDPDDHKTFKDRKYVSLLSSYLLVSIFNPPEGSRFLRVERFLCLIFILVGGCFSSCYIQYWYHADLFESPDVPSGYQSGLNDRLTALLGSASYLPFLLFLRSLHNFFGKSSDGHGTKFQEDVIIDVLKAKTHLKMQSEVISALRKFLEILEMRDAATSITGLYPPKTRRWSDSDLLIKKVSGKDFRKICKVRTCKSWPDMSESEEKLNKRQALKRFAEEKFSVQDPYHAGSFLLGDRDSITLSTLSFTLNTSSFTSWNELGISSQTGSSSAIVVPMVGSSEALHSGTGAAKSGKTSRTIQDHTFSLSRKSSSPDSKHSTPSVKENKGHGISAPEVKKTTSYTVNKYGKHTPMRKNDSQADKEKGDFAGRPTPKRSSTSSDSSSTSSSSTVSQVTKSMPRPSTRAINSQSEKVESKDSKVLYRKFIVPGISQQKTCFSTFETFLCPCLIVAIISLSVLLIPLGQDIDSSGAGSFGALVGYSILFTFLVVTVLDMIFAIIVFKEHLIARN